MDNYKIYQQSVTKRKIDALKQELATTDYQAIKYAEGWLTEEEYTPIKASRQAIRNQINELEESLNESSKN